MRRREFIGLLGGVGATWPLATRAQQGERMRRIGVLLPAAADDAEFQARVGAFQQGLALLGWTIGHNVRIDSRWATANIAEIRRHAAELVALVPDIILAHGDTAVGARAGGSVPTRSIHAETIRVCTPAVAGAVVSASDELMNKHRGDKWPKSQRLQ
jgi:putative ABC transport system substrate-binding protein